MSARRSTVVIGVDRLIGVVVFECQCLGTNRPVAGWCQRTGVLVLNVGGQLSRSAQLSITMLGRERERCYTLLCTNCIVECFFP